MSVLIHFAQCSLVIIVRTYGTYKTKVFVDFEFTNAPLNARHDSAQNMSVIFH